ncbi:hypothetical protein RB653_009450 [Dictyostelium firmibasis]|uniref:O-methyltransferase domain-containing protein n=1 Tax=Dictyostelium firmibasis TaxID=79012 RepID=A0AAN7TU96_9MYCE
MEGVLSSLLASSLIVGFPSLIFVCSILIYYYLCIMRKKILSKDSLQPVIGVYIMRCIYSITQYWEMIIPQIKLYRISNDYIVFQCLSVVFTLKVMDYLKNGPKTIRELSQLTKSSEKNLFRVMRALTQEHIFNYNHLNNTFSLNSCSKLLSSPPPPPPSNMYYNNNINNNNNEINNNNNNNNNGIFSTNDEELGCIFSMLSYPTFIDAWRSLKECIETGVSGFQTKHGMTFFQYIDEKDTYIKKIFDSAMRQRNYATKIHTQITHGYDFSKYKKICDIGGGIGFLGFAIVNKNPDVVVCVLELEETVRNGLEQSKVDEKKQSIIEEQRLVFKNGNMFIPRSIPSANLYILMQVIHDWNNYDAIKILSSVASAMRYERNQTGQIPKLLIIDSILDDNINNDTYKRSCIPDIIMMAIVGGEERTLSEWNHLIKESGLQILSIKKFNRPPFLSIIELTII